MRGVISRVAEWADDRTGVLTAGSRFLLEDIPASAGWPEVFGSVALFLFLLQCLTGTLLALNYAPTSGEAYKSVTYILHQVAGGGMIHGLHHWGASLMIIVVFLHMAQVFIFGAFKRPREATWIAGVCLLFLTFAFGLTGYLLPWDNKAYWGTMVTMKIAAGLPVIGSLIMRLAGASSRVGAVTFSRFYTLHTILLPAFTLALIAFHIYLVRRHGITPGTARSVEPQQKFYPKQLFRDFCAVFIAFCCLFVAAAVLNVPLDGVADPTDTTYVPRPEWYFLFLFQLLKMFPGRMELIGTLVLPSLAIAALVLLPFLRRTHGLVLRTRLHSLAVVAFLFAVWLGLTTTASWSTPHRKGVAQGMELARIPPEVIAGHGYFRSFQCESCHNLIVGNPKPGPTLGLVGVQHPRDWLLQHFSDESGATPKGGKGGSLSIPERNALLIYVSSIKPDSIQSLTSISPSLINGAQTFVANACASCHRINGIGGGVGPSLNGLGNRRSESWIREHFTTPGKLSPGSIMPPYQFAPKDEQDLIAYLFSLSE